MKRFVLVAGDILILAIVTLIGFGSHGELSAAFVPRMAASFVPLCIGWFLLAPSLGLFDRTRLEAASELWRPAFAMLLAGPLAALVRGILLNSPVVPTFAVVLTLTAALGLTVWRLVCWAAARRLSAH